MSWWQTWGSKLSNPADNVVAAVIVLAGVVVTAVVTLLVSAANRRHERLREDRGRVFQSRAETYLDASTYMFELEQDDPERSVGDEDLEKVYLLSSRLSIYGTKKAAVLFYDAVVALLETRQLELHNAPAKDQARAFEKSEDLKADFNHAARVDVQGLRGKPMWTRWARRRVTRTAKKVRLRVLSKKPAEEG